MKILLSTTIFASAALFLSSCASVQPMPATQPTMTPSKHPEQNQASASKPDQTRVLTGSYLPQKVTGGQTEISGGSPVRVVDQHELDTHEGDNLADALRRYPDVGTVGL